MARSWRPASTALLLAAAVVVCAGGCGGGGDKPPSFTPVSVTSEGSLYTLELGDMKMVVDAAYGARITEFSLRGENALVTRDQSLIYGSTYWPSPQANWCPGGVDCWPPPEAIDSGPYTGAIDGVNPMVALTSGAQSIGGIPGSAVVVMKQFLAVPESGAVDVTYALANASPTDSLALAPWQVSRVAVGGLTFFGKGSGPVTYAPNTAATFTVNEMGGLLWYESGPVAHDSKAFADGTGWIAHVTPERLLFHLTYQDFQAADAAPGEAEIEVYTNGSYVEVEAQGPLIRLEPGNMISWTVRWKVRPVPSGTTVAAGSAQLETLAAATFAE